MYTDKELLIFAKILKKNCENHVCEECPFKKDSNYECIINVPPYNWVFNED